MSEATCAVLTAIFPLVLLTVVLNRRSIHLNIRRKSRFPGIAHHLKPPGSRGFFAYLTTPLPWPPSDVPAVTLTLPSR